MGNSSAQSMVDDWVSSQHGGPENPDDPDDLWYWQHKGTVDWDFAEQGKFAREGGETRDIEHGTLGTHWDLGSTVAHSSKGGNKRTESELKGGLGVERDRTLDGVKRSEAFRGENKVSQVRTASKEGALERTTDMAGGAKGSVRTVAKDGATTVDTKQAHGLKWTFDQKKTGTRDPEGSIFFNDAPTYDKTASQKGTAAYDGDWSRKTTTKVADGKDARTVAVGGGLGVSRDFDGKSTQTDYTGSLGASVKDESVRKTDTGELSTSRKVYGELGGKRSVEGDKTKGFAKAKLGIAGEREETTTAADGAKVATTLSGDASAHGKVTTNAKGQRTYEGGLDLEGAAAREWERERADGTVVVDDVAASGKLGGDVKRKPDGTIVVDGTAAAELSGGRTWKGTREDGAKTTTKVGGKLGGEGTLAADGKHSGAVDAELAASHQIRRKTEDGSVTDTVRGKLSGGAGAKAYKDGARTTLDAGAEVGAGRKIVTELEDGKRTTELGGTVRGSTARQEVAGGVKHTHKAGVGVDASTTRTRKTETGQIDNTVAGGADVGTTVVVGPKGERSVIHDGKLKGDWERTHTERVAGGTMKSTVGAGAEVRGKTGTDAKGNPVRGAGATVTAQGTRSSTVEDPDGTVTETRYTGKGSVGGDVERVGDKTTRSADGKVTLGAERTRTSREGEGEGAVDVSRTVGGDLTTGVKGKSDGTGTGTADLALRGEQKRRWTEDGRSVETVNTQGANVGGTLDRTKDGWKSSQTAGVAAGSTRKEKWTDEAGVRHETTRGLSGDAGISRDPKDLRGTVGGKWDQSHKTVTTGADGAVVTRTVGNTVSGKADVGRKTGADAKDGGVSADWTRSDATKTERRIEGGKVVDTTGSESSIGAGYRTDKGASLKVGQTWKNGTTTTMDDGSSRSNTEELSLSGSASKGERQVGLSRTTGTATKAVSTDGKTTTETSDKTTVAGGLSTKDGLTLSRKNQAMDSRTTEKLSDTTTLTTTRGETSTDVNAGVKRDSKGNTVASAGAKASATAFSQEVAYDNGKGVKGSAGYELGKAEANAKGSATIGKDGVKVKGSAGASVTLVGGNAKIEAPVFTWSLLGEPVRVKLTAGVSAAVVAEANGELELDVSKGENLGVTVGGGGRAFAGAKAGVEVGAHIQWMRHGDYSQLLMDFLDDIPGVGRFVDDVPVDLWKQISQVLVGTGTSDLLIAKAGVFGSAGIGGEASFGLKLQGGRVQLQGDLNGAIGLGGGAKTSLDLDAVDGIRFGGVLALRGVEWIKDHIAGAAAWTQQIISEAQRRIDAYMEEKKAKGGWKGAMASAVDWLGDDLFDLW
jgi:hypothetical protein